MVNEHRTIQCGATLDIGTVCEMFREMKVTLDGSSRLDVNLEQISHFDTAGLQLLCALSAAAKHSNVDLQFKQPPEELRAAVEQLDLRGLLDGWPNSETQNTEGNGA